jgi:hypothetical protein
MEMEMENDASVLFALHITVKLAGVLHETQCENER